MTGDIIAAAVLSVVAAIFAWLSVRDRIQTGQWTVAARTRLKIAAIFVLVVAWLASSR